MSAGVQPRVDVVVVSYNSRDELRDCVEPLSGEPLLHVVVVDNASSDGSLEALADLPVERIQLARNLGFGSGCNVGWRSGSAPYVLFLNPDARIAPEAALGLADTLERTRAGAAAPQIVDELGVRHWSLRRFPSVRSIYGQALFVHRLLPTASWVDEVIRDGARYEREGPCEWASGACLLTRRELLERLGGFDEGFFMYREDVDLCRRIWDEGQQLVYTPRIRCVHVGGRSAPRWSLLRTLARSRIRYAEKHFGRGRSLAYRTGVALNAATHLVAGRSMRTRLGHLQALIAAVRAPFGTWRRH